jgi:SAM-dependent methyltransferase
MDFYRHTAGNGPRKRGAARKDKDMGKGQALEAADLAGYRMNPSTFEAIERARGLSRKERGAYQVLDFGCGRGRAVIHLRREGFAAFGVDADPVPIENGRRYLRETGEAPETVLSAPSDGAIPVPDHGFDFCFSDQVLEHVAELDAVAADLYRCLRPGGNGRHVFPARWRPVEPHVKMPFFHWLPRNLKVREWGARLWLCLGRDPHWPNADGLSIAEKASLYARYTLEKTHYRSLRDIRSTFERQGFRVRFAGEGTVPGLAWLKRHIASVQLDLEKPTRRQATSMPERTAEAAALA